MNVIQQLRYLSFVLIAIVSLHACSNKSSDSASTATDASSKATRKEWFANMNDAYAQSVKVQKPILAYFTASDTCALCKQMDADVISTPVFKAWAEKNVVLLVVDFSKDKQLPEGNNEQSAAMVEYLKVTSFPVIWILNVTHEVENGRFKVKPIGYAGYQPSPEKLTGALQNFIPRRKE